MKNKVEKGSLPNTCQYTTHTDRGDYVIQVSWPLRWSDDRLPAEDDDEPVFTIYLVDGNAYFFTAVDITRRLEFTNNVRSIVVGVGYPRTKYVYDWRRGPDLTPPTPDGKYDFPLGCDGKPRTDISYGEAHKFLDFIETDVMSYVQSTLFPHIPLQTGRKALFGHSYGGIFALNALYTRPNLFDLYIAASPTIWWSNNALVKNQEAAFRKSQNPPHPPPSLFISWGTGAQELEKGSKESEWAFAKRKEIAEEPELKESAMSLVDRLKACEGVGTIWTREFRGEDHGSAAVAGLQRGIMKFLVES